MQRRSTDAIAPFATFIPGTCNQRARRAAQALVRSASARTELLLVQGRVGTGKSHLLRCIELAWRHRGRTNVLGIDGEAFMERGVAAIRAGEIARFKAGLRTLHGLAIDDVDHWLHKQQVCSEFLAMLEEVRPAGSRLCLSARRFPRYDPPFVPLARRLFGRVCLVTLGAPDRETRMRLLSDKTARWGIRLSAEAAELICRRRVLDIRAIDALAKRLAARAAMAVPPIPAALLREWIAEDWPL